MNEQFNAIKASRKPTKIIAQPIDINIAYQFLDYYQFGIHMSTEDKLKIRQDRRDFLQEEQNEIYGYVLEEEDNKETKWFVRKDFFEKYYDKEN